MYDFDAYSNNIVLYLLLLIQAEHIGSTLYFLQHIPLMGYWQSLTFGHMNTTIGMAWLYTPGKH